AALQDAIRAVKNAGILIIVASGNDGINKIDFPAQYPAAIAVGSVNDDLRYGVEKRRFAVSVFEIV
ncbi:S8 family serine peptidase, partial [Paenibacillus germinis]|uniref:S8 family serine peptidase n=1 Tax=Paenibacillus germinis TaxID=2654979 RepID=UPI001FEC39AC